MTNTNHTTKQPMDPMRKHALWAGLFYIATFVFSIPALGLYDGVFNDTKFVLGSGNDNGVLFGGFIEILTGLTGIGTALALYPIVRKYSPARAVGFVVSRTLEASMIFMGVIALLAVFTLRNDFAGTDAVALTAVANALVAVKDWTFLLGPGIMPAINALCLATVLYQSKLVPRLIPTMGIIGAPILLASAIATLFGAWDQVSAPAMLFALPIAAWEFSLGVYMTVKGFRSDAVEPPSEDELVLSARPLVGATA